MRLILILLCAGLTISGQVPVWIDTAQHQKSCKIRPVVALLKRVSLSHCAISDVISDVIF